MRREEGDAAAEGAFVVVVVVVADKESGGNGRDWRRHGVRRVMGNDVMPDSMYVTRRRSRWLPIGEGRWQGWRHWRQ
ncbi:MAG: hypothetical protein JNJ78_03685 [Anaerolineae bacterium]|nr:hypothetical protein [Anaerolineae bacterium]